MAFDFKEFGAQIALAAIKGLAEAEIGALLAKFKELNPVEYPDLIKGMHSNFTLLAKLATQTKTKIDDGIVDFVLKAVDAAALADNIPV